MPERLRAEVRERPFADAAVVRPRPFDEDERLARLRPLFADGFRAPPLVVERLRALVVERLRAPLDELRLLLDCFCSCISTKALKRARSARTARFT